MTDEGGHPIEGVEFREGVPTEAVAPETIRSGLASDRASVRSRAATAAAGLTHRDPGAVLALAPTLVDCLQSDQRVVVYQCLLALSHVAEDDPAALVPAVDRLVALLSWDLSLVRMLAARILGAVVRERPAALVPHAGALVAAASREPSAVLDPTEIAEGIENRHARESLQRVNRDEQVQQARARETLVNVLVVVAGHDPAAVAPHVADLAELLADDSAAVVAAAADSCRLVAEADPAAAGPARDALCDALAHPAEAVVAAAVPALGYLGDPAAIEPLQALAADADRSAELRDLARDTADFLASRGG